MPLNKWKDITYSWVKRLNIIKMAMLSFAYQPINTIVPINTIPTKKSASVLVRSSHTGQKIYMETQGKQDSQKKE